MSINRIRFLAASVFCFLVWARPAVADSDGYYCVGPGYVAYQFGMAPPSPRPHRLYVVQLTRDGFESDPLMIELPQFQVHGLLCEANSIRVGGYEAQYTVDLAGGGRTVTHTPYSEPGRIPREFTGRAAPSNLGTLAPITRSEFWGRKVRLTLDDGDDSEFALEFIPNAPTITLCSGELATKIIGLDPDGRIFASREVFRGILHRECGD